MWMFSLNAIAIYWQWKGWFRDEQLASPHLLRVEHLSSPNVKIYLHLYRKHEEKFTVFHSISVFFFLLHSILLLSGNSSVAFTEIVSDHVCQIIHGKQHRLYQERAYTSIPERFCCIPGRPQIHSDWILCLSSF